MVRADLIGHTRNGIEYIKGEKKVIFETGIVMPVSVFEHATKLGTLNNILLEYKFKPECCGFDYAYCKSTGTIRKKAMHPKKVEPPAEVTVQSTVEAPKPAVPKVPVRIHRQKVNWFDWAYPKIMLMLSVICSFLSIYFTGTYMNDLQPLPVAYFISVCMLLYGLIGTQMSRRAFKSKHYLQAFIFGITSVCTIGFSMYTALDVNYKKYASMHEIVLASEVKSEGNDLEFSLLQQEIEDNKAQIEILSKTYVVMWDGEKNSNVVIEGKITEKAQNRINELTERNQEINARLIELAHDGAMVEQKAVEKADTLSGLIGALAGVSGNIIQMLILLLPSIFIDLVNVLSITIYNDSCSKEEINEQTR